MPKHYKGFSKQDHDEAAQAINTICKQLIGLCEKILLAYGVSSPIGKEIQGLALAPNVMNRLKSKLDDAYCSEHRGKANESPYSDGRGLA